MNNLQRDLLQVTHTGIMENKNKIPVTLRGVSEVRVSLYDISGTKVADFTHSNLNEGAHEIHVDGLTLGIPEGNYVYQAEIINNAGTEKYCRIVSVAH